MRLVVLEMPGLPQGVNRPHEFNFEDDATRSSWVVGRQLGNDIHLVDSSVSRRHAEISPNSQGLLVRDLGSSNGTFINERPVPPNVQVLAHPGERIRFGNVVTLLEAGPLAARNNVSSEGATVVGPIYEYAPRPSTPVSRPPLHAEPDQASPFAPPSYSSSALPSAPQASPGNYQPMSQSLANGYSPAQPRTGPEMAAYPPRVEAKPQPPYLDNLPRINPATPVESHMRPQPLVGGRPPEVAKQPPAKTRPARRKSIWGWLVPLILLLIILAGLTFILLGIFSNSGSNNTPAVSLPSTVFSSPANNDTALGLNISRPSSWKRNEVGNNQVLFVNPDNPTILFNLEKPPSSTILDANLAPDMAVRQYIANVKARATKSQVVQDVASTKFKDGTQAYVARLIFSTNSAPVVTDYNMIAVSFRCGNTLYFASAAAEGKDYTAAVKTDLDAAIANITCGK
ncbi:MAG TPA: FHA domain-containing protein [Chloroflexia bacterium]|nr:FHA domain-containing protein [Chloroflexia bacterium]